MESNPLRLNQSWWYCKDRRQLTVSNWSRTSVCWKKRMFYPNELIRWRKIFEKKNITQHLKFFIVRKVHNLVTCLKFPQFLSYDWIERWDKISCRYWLISSKGSVSKEQWMDNWCCSIYWKWYKDDAKCEFQIK